MTIYPYQVGALLGLLFLMALVYLRQRTTIRLHHLGSAGAFAGGGIISMLLIFLPPPNVVTFAYGLTTAFGGTLLTSAIIRHFQITNLEKQNRRYRGIYLQVLYESAYEMQAKGVKNAHDYIDEFAASGAIGPEDADLLHDQLIMLASIPRQ